MDLHLNSQSQEQEKQLNLAERKPKNNAQSQVQEKLNLVERKSKMWKKPNHSSNLCRTFCEEW